MIRFIGFEFLPEHYKKYNRWGTTFVGRYTFYWFRIWRLSFMYKSEVTKFTII